MNHITIIGLGLIGSSIARAVKQNIKNCHIHAIDPQAESLAHAKALGVIDSGHANNIDSRPTELVIIAAPLGMYESIIQHIAPQLSDDTLLSDVGSVKEAVTALFHRHIPEKQWPNIIPAHPIAGSEKTGFDAGRADLFTGKKLILTPDQHSSPKATDILRQFWESLSSAVITMDAATHDATYALTSHIPQALAFCFARALEKHTGQTLRSLEQQYPGEFCGFTRLCASSPALWADIFLLNRQAILNGLKTHYSSDIPSPERIRKAAAQRATLGDTTPLAPLDYKHPNPWVHFLPKIIACQMMESLTDYTHIGSGFLGMTQNLLYIPSQFEEAEEKSKEEIRKLIQSFNERIESFALTPDSGKTQPLLAWLQAGL